MKEKSSTISITSLTLGVMSIITVFGGYTVFLGLIFSFIGILTGIRGRRYTPTKLAKHAVRISVFGFVLCAVVVLIFTGLYLSSLLDFSFNFHTLYDAIVNVVERILH